MSEMEVNERGGRQSRVETGFHLGYPSRGALEVAQIIKAGAVTHGVDNWRVISVEDHVNHAVTHLMELLDPHAPAGEDHLAHAACRLLMALDVRYFSSQTNTSVRRPFVQGPPAPVAPMNVEGYTAQRPLGETLGDE